MRYADRGEQHKALWDSFSILSVFIELNKKKKDSFSASLLLGHH